MRSRKEGRDGRIKKVRVPPIASVVHPVWQCFNELTARQHFIHAPRKMIQTGSSMAASHTQESEGSSRHQRLSLDSVSLSSPPVHQHLARLSDCLLVCRIRWPTLSLVRVLPIRGSGEAILTRPHRHSAVAVGGTLGRSPPLPLPVTQRTRENSSRRTARSDGLMAWS